MQGTRAAGGWRACACRARGALGARYQPYMSRKLREPGEPALAARAGVMTSRDDHSTVAWERMFCQVDIQAGNKIVKTQQRYCPFDLMALKYLLCRPEGVPS